MSEYGPIERFMNTLGMDVGLEAVSLEYDYLPNEDNWKAGVTRKHCTWTGKGDSPEEALVEAWLKFQIGQWAYGAGWDEEFPESRRIAWRAELYASVGMEVPEPPAPAQDGA